MADIDWGSRYEWPVVSVDDGTKGDARSFGSCEIDTDKFVIAYGIQNHTKSDDREGRVLVATVSGTAVTFSDYIAFCAAGFIYYAYDVRVRKLDTNKFVVTYAKYVDATRENLYARVGTVSGTTITLGSEVDVSGQPVYTAYHHLEVLSSTKFVVSYCEDISSTYRGMVTVCTISGTTITAGNPAVFLDNRLTVSSMCKLGTDRLLVVFKDAYAAGLRGVVDTIATRTSSFGSTYILDADYGAEKFNAQLIHAGKVLVAYNTAGVYTTSKGLIRALTISGSVITIGDATEFQACAGTGQGPNSISIVILTNQTFVIIYLNTVPTADAGTSCYSTLVSSIITLGGKQYWDTDGVSYEGLNAFHIGGYKVAAVYCIGANTYYARIGEPSTDPISYPEYPSIGTTRVSSLVHRWVPGSYTLEMVLGGITSDLGLIIPTGRPTSIIPTLPSCQADEVLTWSPEKGYFCMKVSDIPLGKY